jgi:hypothetical protein
MHGNDTTAVEFEEDPPVEITVSSWPAARRMLARFIPTGQEVWEGTEAAYFATTAPHMLPFYLVIVGDTTLTLYCRSLAGALGEPIAIVRISRLVALELPRQQTVQAA